MEGWNTNFRMWGKRPIFRGKLLVSGRVYDGFDDLSVFFIIVCLFSLRNMLESFSWRDWQVGTRIYFKKNDHKNRTRTGSWQRQCSLICPCLWHCSWKKVSFISLYSKNLGITMKSLRLACFTLSVLLRSESTMSTMVAPVCTKGMALFTSFHDLIHQKLPNKTKEKWLRF